jgi:hypothetical protein
MINTPAIIEHFTKADQTRDEMLKLVDDLIMQENVAVEYYRDILKHRQERLNDCLLNAQTECSVKIGHCEQRIHLFESMKECLVGKDTALVLPANPLFIEEVPQKKKLFGRK